MYIITLSQHNICNISCDLLYPHILIHKYMYADMYKYACVCADMHVGMNVG